MSAAALATATRLDEATLLDHTSHSWSVTVFPAAREAVLCLVPTIVPARVPSGKPVDHERAEREATRRAATKVRRLCAANGLDRLWTLTYAVEPTGEAQVLEDMARFNRRMKATYPKWRYLYVIERGSRNGRLHVHFATNAFVPKATVAARWNHGFVDCRRITTGRNGDARGAARYLAKYVTKSTGDGGRDMFRRRYVPGLGLVLQAINIRIADYVRAEAAVSLIMGAGAPSYVWRSTEAPDWRGPPCTVAWWPIK